MSEARESGKSLAEVTARLTALDAPRPLAVNERHGDDHGVKPTALRALAKQLRTPHDLARELWAPDDTAARLLALLVCRPKAFGRDELDAMVRETRARKVHGRCAELFSMPRRAGMFRSSQADEGEK